MTAASPHDRDRHQRARRAGNAGAARAAGAAARARAKSWSRSRPPASTGPTCVQRQGTYPPPQGRDRHSGPRDRGRGRRARRRREALEARRQGLALVVGGGYARILPRAREPRAAGAAVAVDGRSGRDPGDLLHRLAQRVRARRAEERRNAAGAWRLVRHRHHRDPCSPRRSARKVITTAGSAEKCEACRKLGADVAVNYKTEDFVAATKKATGGKGADVILDMVGGDYIERNYEAAAVEGRIVQIAFTAGPKATVEFRRAHAQAPAPTPARRCGRARSPTRPRSRAALEEKVLAADRGRQDQAGDRLAPFRWPRPPPPMPAWRSSAAYRQDRADGLICRLRRHKEATRKVASARRAETARLATRAARS